jgi:endonuclease/exonuclease/phosphatase family metal-dependent hydrolase
MATVIAYLGQFVGATQQGLFALVIFGLAMLAPVVRKLLGERATLALTIGGIALVRLFVQFASTPLAQLVGATIGLILLGWFLPVWHQSPRNRTNDDEIPILVPAFALAFLLDVTSRTILMTYDLAWRRDPISMIVTVVVCGIVLGLLWFELKQRVAEEIQEPSLGHALSFLGLGAFLYLALAIVHNSAVLIAASKREDFVNEIVVATTILSACLGIAAAGWRTRWQNVLGVGAVLVLAVTALTFFAPVGELWFALSAITVWVCVSWLLTSTTCTAPLHPGLWRTSLATFLAFVLMLVSVFVVGQYKLNTVNIVAGIVVLATTLWATRYPRAVPRADLVQKLVILAIGVGVIAWYAIWSAPLPRPSSIAPQITPAPSIRVMTYNIHQGISADFQVNLDAIAETIAAQNPDIIVLNEVNRARPNYGLIDTLPLIANRLGMDYVFGANYPDNQYGNAILTRAPILESNNTHYRAETTETRGVLRAVIDSPIGKVTIYGTHLDHISGAKNVRAQQVAEFLQIWNKAPYSILMGDLNAEPGKPELQAIYQAGWVDALRVAGKDDAFTFWDPTPTPGRRIDYIFVTPDLRVIRADVIQTRASDHLPVIAEIGK